MDRSFVQGVAESLVDSAIVRAIIDLANAMGLSVVAEGVETKDQVAGLKMLGCQVGQGFYFSQPLRAEEFDELLTRHFARTAGPAGPVLAWRLLLPAPVVRSARGLQALQQGLVLFPQLIGQVAAESGEVVAGEVGFLLPRVGVH